MFKSFVSKFIVSFTLILVVSFTLVVVTIGAIFTRYTINAKMSSIDKCSEGIVRFLETRGATEDEPGFKNVINEEYDSLKTYLTSLTMLDEELLIFICNSDGVIVNNSEVPYGTFNKDIPPAAVEQMRTLTKMTQMNLDSAFYGDYLCYVTPVRGSGDVSFGSIVVCTSSAAMTHMVNVVIRILLIVIVCGIIVTVSVMHILSRRISRPLLEMSEISRSFAQGDFERRVKVQGRDEVAQLAVAFNNMADKLSDVENQRRNFLSNIAHDLRTPMTTISGFIDAILDGAIPPEKYDYYLGVVGSEVKRLSRLVSLLLDITRIESGTRKFNIEPVDICEIARNILISNEQRLEEKKLDVEFECDKDNMYANADRDAIHQCIYNLCDNAIKFSRDGGKYRISVKEVEHKIFFSVFNEGRGIKEEDLPHVFDRFFKSDKSRGLDKGGLGLGLYIVRTIINALGGEIWVKSRFGENCEFVFSLVPADKKPARRALIESGE